MTKYNKYYAKTKNGYTEWVRPIRKGYKFACCDCGLVHDMDFRVTDEWRGRVVEFRARRNDLSTSAMRKWRKNNA
jgi:hypothetical protein